ncbi:MAG: sensor histidine kinase KdpD [Candidatus Wallbacteria bacterium]|nr:sensor histidine kinase KdpD [Candidatus Wallbacteria bacterium]
MTFSDETRPDPQLLLDSIRQAEKQKQLGKLRIFFGMSAGVGKTYAMLQAAHQLRKAGLDVAVALVETHDRTETQALLANLRIIPRKKTEYRGMTLEELDIDAVLACRPQVVLVDELAHTNAPGSRHEKRWQDVLEILDNGIDVFSSLNVQHIESRNEDVESITGIRVNETVPDSLLEQATQIELVDITPAELLDRLREGKVYLGERAAIATENFFKVEKLTALRELALKITGEVVSNELLTLAISEGHNASTAGRGALMVAVSHSPHSQKLVRAARRLAFAAEMPWVAANIDSGVVLNDEEKTRLSKNLELARSLGARIITTSDTDIVLALKRIAEQQNVSQIIVGRPRSTWIRNLITGGTLLDRLVKETNIDIHVLREHKITRSLPATRYPGIWLLTATGSDYLKALLIIAAITMLNSFLMRFFTYQSIGFVYLLAIMFIGSFSTLGPLLLSAVLSATLWNYIFIPPTFTFFIFKTEDIMMCIAYGFTAIITAVLANRIRKNRLLLQSREARTELLFEIVEIIAQAAGRIECLQKLSVKLGTHFDGACSIIYKKADRGLEEIPVPFSSWLSDPKEWAVAQWSFDNNRPAGWSTDTLSRANAIYFPLKGPTDVLGVVSLSPHNPKRPFTIDEKNLLAAIAWQCSAYLERDLLKEKVRESERLKESERLHQTILDCISHEIKTPLTAIIGLTSVLENEQSFKDSELRAQILEELGESVERLNREVNNILDMSRLNSGVINLKLDWNDLREIIDTSLTKLDKFLKGHQIRQNIAKDLPFARIDFSLFESALTNLLINAAKYTPEDSCIEISAFEKEEYIIMTIADNGPGIPEDHLPSVFDKFYRVPGTSSGGTGLGLSIARSVIEMHGGTIEAHNRQAGGLEIMISLPLEKQPNLGSEE